MFLIVLKTLVVRRRWRVGRRVVTLFLTRTNGACNVRGENTYRSATSGCLLAHNDFRSLEQAVHVLGGGVGSPPSRLHFCHQHCRFMGGQQVKSRITWSKSLFGMYTSSNLRIL